MDDCIFCKIVTGETDTNVEMENDRVVLIKEARPLAPVHYLIIPKDHIKDVTELETYVWEDVRKMITNISTKLKLDGFRLTTYAGSAELVNHLSFHLLSGVNDIEKK
ncbi:MAG TPA: HIT domain-containing protein [Patescibacteria group bacterium]|nr:HIT domain-containing protein [Patescibacteria group bacterium]